jgi:hypothetical protein
MRKDQRYLSGKKKITIDVKELKKQSDNRKLSA